MVRRDASRTAANASGRISSRVAAASSSPASARRSRKPAVFSAKAESGSARKLSARPLTSATIGRSRRSVRSFALPKRRVRNPGMRNGAFSSPGSGTSSQTVDTDRRIDPGAEEAGADADEAIGHVSDEEARGARAVAPPETAGRELRGDVAGRFLGGIDQHDALAHHLGDERLQHWVVPAAPDQPV